ncbi:Uma2 family endonuclease [Chloroflexi bacterium TSY]|nr:Uma2 family endonuclease [Chloroflexi bacterium TSY]
MDTIVMADEVEEFDDMASFNHGYIQAKLVILLDRIGRYTPVTELSLDISGIDLSQFDIRTKEEIKPDICLYPKRGLSRPTDILRMAEMPLLVAEILSPKQGTYDILEKFKVYFALGIQSCWLVEPALNTVTIYSSMDNWRTFSNDEAVDEAIDIRLSIDEIFS